jgi:hypothetical protein
MPRKHNGTQISDMIRVVVAPTTKFRGVCRQPREISRQYSSSLSNGFGLSNLAGDTTIGVAGMHHVDYSVINPRCRLMIADNLLDFLTHQSFHSRASLQNLAAPYGSHRTPVQQKHARSKVPSRLKSQAY